MDTAPVTPGTGCTIVWMSWTSCREALDDPNTTVQSDPAARSRACRVKEVDGSPVLEAWTFPPQYAMAASNDRAASRAPGPIPGKAARPACRSRTTYRSITWACHSQGMVVWNTWGNRPRLV